jgi:hypothetical protein
MNKEIEKESVNTVCPHCLREITMVWVCKIESVIGKRYIFFCGECQKNLGTSHEKKFTSSVFSTLIKKTPSGLNNSL